MCYILKPYTVLMYKRLYKCIYVYREIYICSVLYQSVGMSTLLHLYEKNDLKI